MTDDDTLVCRDCGFEVADEDVSDLPVVEDEEADLFAHTICPECEGHKWGRADPAEVPA